MTKEEEQFGQTLKEMLKNNSFERIVCRLNYEERQKIHDILYEYDWDGK